MTEYETVALATIASCLVLVSLIGGCTYTVTTPDQAAMMRICIGSGNDWVDGDCVNRAPRKTP